MCAAILGTGLCADCTKLEAENGELTKMILMPVEEYFALPRSRNGWPKKDTNSNIMERFAEMSKPWGVDIKIENGMGVVQL